MGAGVGGDNFASGRTGRDEFGGGQQGRDDNIGNIGDKGECDLWMRLTRQVKLAMAVVVQ